MEVCMNQITKNDIEILQKTTLFLNMSEAEIREMLDCLNARKTTSLKNTMLLHYGDFCDSIGIVLHGTLHITREDFWGNSTLIAQCVPGDIFGETYAMSPNHIFEVNVTAITDSEILFLQLGKILSVCSTACTFHNRLIQNLLQAMASRNYLLSKKIEHITKRSTRDKLLSYLSNESRLAKSADFTIPLNRQQLADYLAVDRSAMSAELCRLRDEGILSFHKNEFHLYDVY